MGNALKKLTIRGFKSIAALEDLELGNLNVLIGANGAGKSNFVGFFRMLRSMANEELQKFIIQHGGGDGFFFLGPKYTQEIFSHLDFGNFSYEFNLVSNVDGSLIIADEASRYTESGEFKSATIGSSERESNLREFIDDFYDGIASEDESLIKGLDTVRQVFLTLSNWTVYHFHDTSRTAPMRRDQSVRDWEYLRPDAANIAAYLLYLSEHAPQAYAMIRDTVRQAAPFFDDFMLRPVTKGPEELVRLEWRQKGSDFPFQPYQLSDGTIRFICLTTALLQPNPPSTIVIDEPELGLHPYALSLLAAMMQSAATRMQLIVSTQSPTLLDHFAPEDIIVVNRHQGQSVFERLSAERLKDWLEEYTLGELWQKNVVEGGPAYE